MSEDRKFNIVIGLFALSSIVFISVPVFIFGPLEAMLGLAAWMGLWVMIFGFSFLWRGIRG